MVTPCLRMFTSALLKLPLALAYSEMTEPLEVFRRVISPTGRRAAGERERTESLANSQPPDADVKLVSNFTDCVCPPLSKHAYIFKAML